MIERFVTIMRTYYLRRSLRCDSHDSTVSYTSELSKEETRIMVVEAIRAFIMNARAVLLMYFTKLCSSVYDRSSGWPTSRYALHHTTILYYYNT